MTRATDQLRGRPFSIGTITRDVLLYDLRRHGTPTYPGTLIYWHDPEFVALSIASPVNQAWQFPLGHLTQSHELNPLSSHEGFQLRNGPNGTLLLLRGHNDHGPDETLLLQIAGASVQLFLRDITRRLN
jgi:hypothetical protein